MRKFIFPRAFVAACLVAAAAGALAATPEEDFKSGEASYSKGDIVGAMPTLKRAADGGHAGAQVRYGYIAHQAGFTDEAVRYYKLAADQGNPEGQHSLAVIYAAGEGVPADERMARQLFEQAARQGHVLSVQALSAASMGNTLGFKEGDSDGFGWVKKAADHDHMPSLQYLAKGYRSGAFGAVELAEAERIEARIKKLSGEADKKARKKGGKR